MKKPGVCPITQYKDARCDVEFVAFWETDGKKVPNRS